jgi:hypothetical protein
LLPQFTAEHKIRRTKPVRLSNILLLHQPIKLKRKHNQARKNEEERERLSAEEVCCALSQHAGCININKHSIAIITQEDHFARDAAEREADIRLQRKADERQELKHQREEGATFIFGSFNPILRL